MQLTIKAIDENVQAISYLLAKNPNNIYERNHKGHLVRLFYSTFTDTELEVTIFVTPDPLELIKNNANMYDITHYINDREFAVSSIFCSLIRSALGTALNGQPKEEFLKWVDHSFSFEFSFGPVVTNLSDDQIKDLFEPLGYEINITYGETDYSFHLKSKSSAKYIALKGKNTLQNALRQIFILIPVLDNYKHYFIDEKEVEKLERYGEGWLEKHPQKDFIMRQSLRFKELYKFIEHDKKNKKEFKQEETKVRLNDLRYEKIINMVQGQKNKEKIVDFGSGEGKLSLRLGFVDGVKEILAVEPSETATIRAVERFNKVENQERFITPTPIWGSLFYYDERLKNKDIMILCEVIEHIDEYRLPKIMETIFREYEPKLLIITTPNKEYNELYNMDEHFRHEDHRFEWTREQFQEWCLERASEYPYELIFDGIGEKDKIYGFPTQICMFIRKED
ncbi:3' terminal RNA ribose 2'-O-methyltransferase Hen1 [Metabacillus fastidiosus]|uniref:Small RNA 2'-O-methyltransferase n=1 Tax=Metabacillus fastidiosus TaxID=1458 RepID=A0ABU6NU86_9BACI|nr:3' terminal RNA ribose 2'-O-methyltransferase Hen1 [Metabacillus fastidiosus]MED4400465.1 3' terminal RNA ribose 2'-O-methyltransferase Hen1 [Metabacillus fastidiosus]MED4464349.1 3' terminal RNA ribose 2'-O-methyltransferase Hen1 [Metabacillus fastidiosus]